MSNDNLKEKVRSILVQNWISDPGFFDGAATEIAALVQPLVDERDALKMGMASASATLNNLWRAGDLTTGDVATRIEKAILSREDEIRTLGSSRPNAIYDLLRADVLAARSVLSKCDDYDANKSLSDAVTTVVAKYEERLSAARNAAAERTKEISQTQLILDKNSTAPRGPLADRVMFAIGAKIAMIVGLETELREARSAIDAASAVLEKHRPAGPFLGSIAHRIEKIISARAAEISELRKSETPIRDALAMCPGYTEGKTLQGSVNDVIAAFKAQRFDMNKRLEAWQSAVADARDVLRPYPEYDDSKKLADLTREILSRKDAEIAELKKHQHVVHIGVDWEKSDAVVSTMRELEQRAKVAGENLSTALAEREAARSSANSALDLSDELRKKADRQQREIWEAHAILDRNSGIKRCALPDRLRMAFTEKAAAAVTLADELEAIKEKHRAAVADINKAVASLQTFPAAARDVFAAEAAKLEANPETFRKHNQAVNAEIGQVIQTLASSTTAAPGSKPAAPKNVVVKVTHGDRILLVRHVDRGWELPGGAIKAGEKDHSAALRELKEEAGIDGNNLTVIECTNLKSPEIGVTVMFNCEAKTMISLAPNDPDGKIINAIWARREDVAGTHRMGFLSELPSRSMILQWAGL